MRVYALLVGRAGISRDTALYIMDDDEISAILLELNEQAKQQFTEIGLICYHIAAPYFKKQTTFAEFWKTDTGEPDDIAPEELAAVEDLADKLEKQINHGR